MRAPHRTDSCLERLPRVDAVGETPGGADPPELEHSSGLQVGAGGAVAVAVPPPLPLEVERREGGGDSGSEDGMSQCPRSA